MRSSIDVSIPGSLSPYISPINTNNLSLYWIILISIGILFMTCYFIYNMSTTRQQRSLIIELLLALLSSITGGFGLLFLLLWSDVWV